MEVHKYPQNVRSLDVIVSSFSEQFPKLFIHEILVSAANHRPEFQQKLSVYRHHLPRPTPTLPYGRLFGEIAGVLTIIFNFRSLKRIPKVSSWISSRPPANILRAENGMLPSTTSFLDFTSGELGYLYALWHIITSIDRVNKNSDAAYSTA
jgi:hypothetical protein